jgi:mannose-1-phosphate guanylyltransferase
MSGQVHVVILCGGRGTRFWPLSRTVKPKQFLSLGEDKASLVRETALRSSPLHDWERLWVVTTEAQATQVEEHLPEARLITEPLARDTAASVGLATAYIEKMDPEGVVVILPADHVVKNNKNFISSLKRAVALARQRPLLVTVGIAPTYAHTGFGYIKRGAELSSGAYEVARFFEKPSRQRAEQYLEVGDCYWNSGMFAWQAKSLRQELEAHLPDLAAGLAEVSRSIGKTNERTLLQEMFSRVEPISIDFGVLEHSRRCGVVEAEPFGWNDVGSWDAWAELYQADEAGNVAVGDTLFLESERCIIHAKRFTAVLGVEDLVVIDSGDALLVCPRNRVQDVKKIVKELQSRHRNELI